LLRILFEDRRRVSGRILGEIDSAAHIILSASCRAALACAITPLVPLAWAAEPSVPYVPTPQDVVDRMLQIARVVRPTT
jgi:hypothetical protein